jgi:hypothetical protein
VHITPVNDAPVADDDEFGVAEDASATALAVLAGDTDVDGDTLTIIAKTNGAKGTVVITGGGTGLTYKPGANLSGQDTFTYTISDGHGGTDTATVTVDIGGDNDPPNAVNDPTMSVPEGAGPTVLDVLANDSDPDGDDLVISGKTNGSHGTVTITGFGTGLTYDPSGNYHGSDSFTYTLSDGHGGTDSATVLVTVVKDTAPPVVVAPTQVFIGQTLGSTTTKVRLTWSASDAGSGVASYKLQGSADGGTSYATVSLPKTTSKTIDRSLTNNKHYLYRVRATDKEGNVSSYKLGQPMQVVRYSQDSSAVAYAGEWYPKSAPKAFGGSSKASSSPLKSATFTFTGTDVGWIATRYTTSGKAKVYVDDVLVRTVDLDTSATKYRQLVFQAHFASVGTHTIRIVPVGDGRADIDGFVIIR